MWKKLVFSWCFLAGVVVGAGGLFWLVQGDTALLELPPRNQPQARVEAFIKAIHNNDASSALNLWEIEAPAGADPPGALHKRRDELISQLMARGVRDEFLVLDIEWWTTCCEPSVTNNSRNAGGARMRVQLLDQQGNPLSVTFDVFTREQPYWGDAAGNPRRDWVIRDVYIPEQQPLFWRMVYEPVIRYLPGEGE